MLLPELVGRLVDARRRARRASRCSRPRAGASGSRTPTTSGSCATSSRARSRAASGRQEAFPRLSRGHLGDRDRPGMTKPRVTGRPQPPSPSGLRLVTSNDRVVSDNPTAVPTPVPCGPGPDGGPPPRAPLASRSRPLSGPGAGAAQSLLAEVPCGPRLRAAFRLPFVASAGGAHPALEDTLLGAPTPCNPKRRYPRDIHDLSRAVHRRRRETHRRHRSSPELIHSDDVERRGQPPRQDGRGEPCDARARRRRRGCAAPIARTRTVGERRRTREQLEVVRDHAPRQPTRRARAGRGAQHAPTARGPSPSGGATGRRCAARRGAGSAARRARRRTIGPAAPRRTSSSRSSLLRTRASNPPTARVAVEASTSHAPGGGETSRVTSASGVSPSGLSMSRPCATDDPAQLAGRPACPRRRPRRRRRPRGTCPGRPRRQRRADSASARATSPPGTSASSASRKQTRAPTARASPSLRAADGPPRAWRRTTWTRGSTLRDRRGRRPRGVGARVVHDDALDHGGLRERGAQRGLERRLGVARRDHDGHRRRLRSRHALLPHAAIIADATR